MSGYFGIKQRMQERNKKLTPVSELTVVIDELERDNKLAAIMTTIRSIDKDRNGFVTN